NVFDTGTDALYAGTWQVRVDSYTISDYMLRVYVYTKGNAIPTEYGTAAFNVTTDVEKIEIVIRAIDVTLNGISANLRNMDSDESTTLTEDRTIIENGKWKVVVDSLPENYEVKVLVYTSAGGNPTDYGTNEFTINSNVNKVEILIQEKVTV
ncbi:MAG: hypothetical protein J6Q15_01935, partial [Clostridia bacterium]|nr:hypothetical protein [Clostridia bacterium]